MSEAEKPVTDEPYESWGDINGMTYPTKGTPAEPARPLNVRVAEALGLQVEDRSYECRQSCVSHALEGGEFPTPAGRGPHRHGGWEYYKAYEWEPTDGNWEPVLEYDTDWGATGWLIEKYRFRLLPVIERQGSQDHKVWLCVHTPTDLQGIAVTALAAVCNLLLVLGGAGKL